MIISSPDRDQCMMSGETYSCQLANSAPASPQIIAEIT